MSSKNEIKDKIVDGFLSALKKAPFEKIKVTEIVKAAGISHQTFYRYYVDKYDLASKISTEIFSAFSVIYGNNATWKEIVISILHSIKNFPILFKRLLADPEGSDIVLNSLIITSEAFTGGKISEPCIAGWIRILKEWSKTDFKNTVENVYNQIRQGMSVHDVLTEEEIEKVMNVYENQRLEFFISKASGEQQKVFQPGIMVSNAKIY